MSQILSLLLELMELWQNEMLDNLKNILELLFLHKIQISWMDFLPMKYQIGLLLSRSH